MLRLMAIGQCGARNQEQDQTPAAGLFHSNRWRRSANMKLKKPPQFIPKFISRDLAGAASKDGFGRHDKYRETKSRGCSLSEASLSQFSDCVVLPGRTASRPRARDDVLVRAGTNPAARLFPRACRGGETNWTHAPQNFLSFHLPDFDAPHISNRRRG